MVKNSSILRDPLLTNTPLNPASIDLCYDDMDGGGTDNIVAVTAREVNVIRTEEKKHFQEEGEICISHSYCCIDRYCPLSTHV